MILTWKDEGREGPVRIYESGERMGSIPYDPNRPQPAWMTRAAARKLAKELGAEFREV